jgi:D-glycero-D-manno-heptose 1,7-bisphosphate phosphatase
MSDLEATDKVVILDRDGTIVVDRHYLSDPAELELLPGAAEGLRWWSNQGYRLVVITNQSGVGRGMFSVDRLNEIHTRLEEIVRAAGAQIEKIYYCPHTPDANCQCRKPRVELLMRAAAELRFNPAAAIVVGDKETDVEFGHRVGATTIFIGSQLDAQDVRHVPDFVAANLADAARLVKRPRSRA